jgi:16S rRNA C1402 (ribose-2'-O) methylase RsmI
MKPGKIYLIPTPIGETEPSDVTPLGNRQTNRSLD